MVKIIHHVAQLTFMYIHILQAMESEKCTDVFILHAAHIQSMH